MRILSRLGQWMLCVCSLPLLASLPYSVSTASAQPKAKEAPKTTKRVVKRAPKSKSVRQCMHFSQKLGADEESVDLALTSNCKFEVVCTLEWQLSCSDDDGTASSTPNTRSTSMLFAEDFQINASAATCDESWEVGGVKWNCVAADE